MFVQTACIVVITGLCVRPECLRIPSRHWPLAAQPFPSRPRTHTARKLLLSLLVQLRRREPVSVQVNSTHHQHFAVYKQRRCLQFTRNSRASGWFEGSTGL